MHDTAGLLHGLARDFDRAVVVQQIQEDGQPRVIDDADLRVAVAEEVVGEVEVKQETSVGGFHEFHAVAEGQTLSVVPAREIDPASPVDDLAVQIAQRDASLRVGVERGLVDELVETGEVVCLLAGSRDVEREAPLDAVASWVEVARGQGVRVVGTASQGGAEAQERPCGHEAEA